MLTSAHLSPLVGSAQRSSSRWWLLHRVVFSGFRGGRRVMARGRKVGGYYLVCPLLSLICPLLFLLRFPPFLSFSFLSLPLTRIHTHVYSHSNQLRRLFFGPRHASRLLAASPARRSSPSGAATIIILVLRSRTELLSPRPPIYIYIYMHPLPCNVSGGQRDVSGSQWCSWDDDKTLSLCLSLLRFIIRS